MAFIERTIGEIFESLLLEKQTLSTLNGLLPDGITDENSLISALSNGKVADWVLWLYNMAVSTNITDIAISTALSDIDSIIANQKIPTDLWFINIAKAFQYGDTVVINPETYQVGYSTIIEANQIIGSCTTNNVSNKLVLKVRRKDTDILSVEEKTAFEGYLFKSKPAGTQLLVENFPADKVTLNMTILYQANLDLTTIQGDVESTIDSYLNNIEFDSKFLTSSMINKLQELDGIIDPRLDSASAIDSLGVTVSFTHEYLSNAGYMVVNPTTPLSTTITYIPK